MKTYIWDLSCLPCWLRPFCLCMDSFLLAKHWGSQLLACLPRKANSEQPARPAHPCPALGARAWRKKAAVPDQLPATNHALAVLRASCGFRK